MIYNYIDNRGYCTSIKNIDFKINEVFISKNYPNVLCKSLQICREPWLDHITVQLKTMTEIIEKMIAGQRNINIT